MSSQVSQTSAASARRAEEPYIPVEELAQRLDLPLAILLRRIEAGDVPARRVESEGSGWGLRLSDLGIDPEEVEGKAEDDEAMSDDTAISNDPPPPPVSPWAGTSHEGTPGAERPMPETPHADATPADDRRRSWSPAWSASSGLPRAGQHVDIPGGDALRADVPGAEAVS